MSSPEEERALLLAHLEATVEAAKKAIAASGEGSVPAKRAIRLVARAQNRLEAVDAREADWLSRLREEDEEILLLLH